MSRFQFVADNSATFEVKRLCALVEIERSSYYAWKAGAPARADRAAADAELAERIRVIHEADNAVGRERTFELTFRMEGCDPAVARRYADEGFERTLIWTDQVWPAGEPLAVKRERMFTAAADLGLAPTPATGAPGGP